MSAFKPEEFGRRVKAAMALKGCRVDSLAADMGVAINSVSAWRHGRLPSIANLIRIADELDVSTDWLLGRTEVPVQNTGGAS